MASKCTQLREQASTELAKFHRIVRSSLYRCQWGAYGVLDGCEPSPVSIIGAEINDRGMIQ